MFPSQKIRHALSTIVMLVALAPQAQSDTTTLPSPVTKIFVPMDFDDNDNTEIVLQGFFPSTCYKVGATSFDIDAAAHTIVVKATSEKATGMICAHVMTPFLQPVKVGILAEGAWDVVLSQNPELKSSFQIRKRTTEAPDDFLYAPVAEATLRMEAGTGRQSLVLSGSFPLLTHGCMQLRDVQLGSPTEDVLLALPIAEIAEGAVCEGAQRDFKVVVGLSQPFRGQGLLHVRSMGGHSLNSFINFPEE
jgi:hypothetical protein